MKKIYYVLLCVLAIGFTMSTLTSCDKDDDDEYYAGESEEDYKPNVYNVTSTWDLSNVSGLSSTERAECEKKLEKTCVASSTYNTRTEAVAAFDNLVYQVSVNDEFSRLVGAKVVFYLKRGSAIIKKASLTW